MPSTVRIRILEARGLISSNYVPSSNINGNDIRAEDYSASPQFYTSNNSHSGNTSSNNQPHTPRFSHGNSLKTPPSSLLMSIPVGKERQQDSVNQNVSVQQQIYQPFSSPSIHSLNSHHQSNLSSSAVETFHGPLPSNNSSLYASSGDVSVDIKFAGNEQRTSVSKRNVGTFREYQMKQDHHLQSSTNISDYLVQSTTISSIPQQAQINNDIVNNPSLSNNIHSSNSHCPAATSNIVGQQDSFQKTVDSIPSVNVVSEFGSDMTNNGKRNLLSEQIPTFSKDKSSNCSNNNVNGGIQEQHELNYEQQHNITSNSNNDS